MSASRLISTHPPERSVTPLRQADAGRRPGHGVHRSSGLTRAREAASLQPELAVDDVLGHVSQQAIVAEGERPQADECLGDADARLDRNHACRVVYREVEVSADLQLPG